MRRVLVAMLMLATGVVAATASTARAQSPPPSPCIPTGVGAAPYTGDWTRLPRTERIALCEEGERRERARQQEEQKKADALPREPQKPPEPARSEQAAADNQAPPGPERVERRFPILRGTDASGLPILTDDPNLLRR